MKSTFISAFLFVVLISNAYADQTATIKWSPNQEADLNGYNIYRSCTPVYNYRLLKTVDKSVNLFIDTTIPDTCSSIYYKISAFDTSNNESKLSESVGKVLPPPAPVYPPLVPVSDLAIRVIDYSSGEITFTEVPNGLGGVANYDVRYSVNPDSWGDAIHITTPCNIPIVGVKVGNIRKCLITGLPSNSKLYFKIVAFSGTMNQGAVYSSISSPVLAVIPEKPKSFGNIKLTDTTISFDYETTNCSSVTKSTKYITATKRTIVMTCVK